MNSDQEIILLKENNEYLWISKPAGLMVHGDGRSDEYTLADWILEKYPELEHIGESWDFEKDGKNIAILRPGIVHRLDKDTSGVMVIAKTQDAYLFLKSAFKNREVKKIYHSFVYEWPAQDRGNIDAPIGRHPKDFRAKSAGKNARGTLRSAQTDFAILAKCEHKGERYAKVEWKPRTGRTHQIRVHAKHIQHPLVADTLYGGKRARRQHNLDFTRHALHAYTLTFTDKAGHEHTITAPYPQDFKDADEKFLAKNTSL